MILYYILVPLAWIVFHIGFRVECVGRENLKKIETKGCILAPNHISAIDPVFVVIARFWGKRLLIMAKEEILQVNPVFTWMFRHVGVVGIERGRGDVNVVDELIGNVQKGQGLLIFPEGTRSKTGQVGKVKSGAFVIASAAGVPMVPCRIIYEPGRMKVFCRVRVCFGTPIPAEELYLGETKSASALRRNKALLTDAWQRLYDENKFD